MMPLNLNIGILGHVDSGKTSLAKALSTVASTACFDKNPQSRERGITIDLGFSSFQVDIPEHLKDASRCDKLQFTLVDCPGHASLIRTIIGGAQIIDMFILVLDVTKGMQTQTAECLVIGEITCGKMTVVLNKCDLLPTEKKSSVIEKMTKKMKATLQNTVFKEAEIVAISANPGGQENLDTKPEGLDQLLESLKRSALIPKRDATALLVFAVDHCFAIRGQGTVLTGTVLQGTVQVNDTVEIPSLRESRKVKSLQMFHQPVESATQGDRLGICVTQFDPKLLERGLACTPGYLPTIYAAVASVNKIRFYSGTITTKSKFHISIGHETLLAKVTFFSGTTPLDLKNIFKYQEELQSDDSTSTNYVLLEFERAVTVIPNCMMIGSKLDMDIHTSTCRLAFWGNLIITYDMRNYATALADLKIFKNKTKTGIIERAPSSSSIIVKNIFKKETNIQVFVGMKVLLSTGEEGIIEGGFGQSGKIKVNIPGGLKNDTYKLLSTKKGETESSQRKPLEITLNFKKFIFDTRKKMIQV